MSISIESWAQTKYSAIFVALSAFGMTLGPGIQSVLTYLPDANLLGLQVRIWNNLACIFQFVMVTYFFL